MEGNKRKSTKIYRGEKLMKIVDKGKFITGITLLFLFAVTGLAHIQIMVLEAIE